MCNMKGYHVAHIASLNFGEVMLSDLAEVADKPLAPTRAYHFM